MIAATIRIINTHSAEAAHLLGGAVAHGAMAMRTIRRGISRIGIRIANGAATKILKVMRAARTGGGGAGLGKRNESEH